MKKLKKMICLTLAMVMALSLCVPAFASEPESDYPEIDQAKEAEIDRLCNLLVQERMANLTTNSSGGGDVQTCAVADQSQTEIELMNAIEALGAVKVSQEFVESLDQPSTNANTGSTVSPLLFEDGWNTTYNDFYSTGPYSMTLDGTLYTYWFLRVVPKPGSKLNSDGFSFVTFQSEQIPLSDFLYAACTMYAQKALGLIPVFTWVPYEFLFNGWSNSAVHNTRGNYAINITSSTTAKYVYVTDHNPEYQYSYERVMGTSSVVLTETHISAYAVSGGSTQHTDEPPIQRTVLDDYYSMPQEHAIYRYRANIPYVFPAPAIQYYEGQGERLVGVYYPKNPLQAPSQY